MRLLVLKPLLILSLLMAALPAQAAVRIGDPCAFRCLDTPSTSSRSLLDESDKDCRDIINEYGHVCTDAQIASSRREYQRRLDTNDRFQLPRYLQY